MQKITSQIDLLRAKGIYPYTYMDVFDKFSEEILHPKLFRKNTLEGGEVTSSNRNLEHANLVYQEPACETLDYYHDLFRHPDFLNLESVFENFLKVCYATHGLDCVHLFTASNWPGEAFLNVSNAEIELLTNREHLEMAENLISAGISSVFAKRNFEANNKYLPNRDPSVKQTFGFFIDANYLDDGILEKFPLSLKNLVLKTESEIYLHEILSTSDDSSIGYMLVDLYYPEDLHYLLSDFPLAPTKEEISFFWLGDYQRNTLELWGTNKFLHKKLILTLYDNTNHTLDYLTLKIYCELGFEVTKIHRVLQCDQPKWPKPYIHINTTKTESRCQVLNESFYKSMSNSAFGKTMESKRKRLVVEKVRTETQLLALTNKMWMKTYRVFNDDLAAITFTPCKIHWNKSTIVGATVLDLSKRYLYWFHYKHMKANFKTLVLYCRTDSLIYEIRSEDLYEDLKAMTQITESLISQKTITWRIGCTPIIIS